MTRVNMPDPQHLMLDALHAEIYRLADEGVLIKQEDLQWLFEDEPESVVFTSSDLEEYDPDEARDVVMMVGGRDLDNKIRYWTGVLETLRSDEYKEETL